MNDEEYGALRLQPLKVEPAAPPRIDVARAMREGRRQRRRRWWSGLTGLTAVTGVVVAGGTLLAPTGRTAPDPAPLPVDPPMPAACVGSRLPAGGDKVVTVNGGDDTGRWIVGTGSASTLKNDHVLVWRDGELAARLPAPAADFALLDANRSGVAVGSDRVFRDGRLSMLAGGTVRGVAINDAGEIAGAVVRNGQAVPARWASPDAQPQLMQAPPDVYADVSIRDIDNEGNVLGVIYHRTYLWKPDGSYREIVPPIGGGRPSAPAGGADFVPAAMRNGWIYGDVDSSEGDFAYRYEPASGTWQQLDGRAGDGVYGDGTPAVQLQSRVRVGRQLLTLPADPDSTREKRDGYLITMVSDDARVIAGHVTGAPGVMDIKPVVWRCR